MKAEHIIPMEKPLRLFREFLEQENNRRIFFSGKFGSGKTFFLRSFFEEKENEKHYDVYHLFPIRYQIMSNEDVMNLMKYDILVKIFEKSPGALEPEPLPCGLKEQVKRFSKALDWNFVLDSIPKIGRPLRVSNHLREAWIEAARKNPQKLLGLYKENIDRELASGLDILLQQKIQELKDEKKSVLILDDLDRMDPEHIFRMLNILSAQMEIDEKNELGFDHIILSGDLENIKHIFQHKYGEYADFQGYFDKFSTVRPYAFSNTEAIVDWIQSRVFEFIQHHESLKDSMEDAGYLRIPLEELLKQLIKAKAINLRQLYKPVHYLLPDLSKAVRVNPLGDVARSPALHLNRSLEVLISLFDGGKDEFINALRKIGDQAPESKGRPLQEEGYNRTYYSILWKIMQGSQELASSSENATHQLFYEDLIRYVGSNCRDGLSS